MNDFFDLLLYNGIVITMDPAYPKATAVGIKGTRIAWVGDSPSFRCKEAIDLKGSCVYPGFADTHLHVLYTALAQQCLQLQDRQNKDAILVKVKDAVKGFPEGKWIFGIGWDDTFWKRQSQFHAADLDTVAPRHPVILRRCDTHLVWVNSLALKLAGIDKNSYSPMGGTIVKDSSGHPTGILIDKGMEAIHRALPARQSKDTIRLVKTALENYLQKGITSVHNAATDEDDAAAFKQLALNKNLPVRVYMMGAVRQR